MQTKFNINRINFLYFTCFVFLVFSFISCSGKENSAQKKEPVQITFSWWGNQPRHDYTLKGVEIFQQQNPDITIECSYAPWKDYEISYDNIYNQNLETDIMLINFDWLFKYSADGAGYYDLYKLDDYIELNNFTYDDLSYGKRNEKLNAIPIAFNTIVPIYDKALFDRYQIKIPENWDELYEAAGALSKNGYTLYGVGRKHLFLLMIAYFEQLQGKRFFTSYGKLNITEKDLLFCIDFLKDAFEKKIFFDDVENFNEKSYENNKIAAAIAWCSESSKYADIFNEREGKALLGSYIYKPDAIETGWYLKPATMYAMKKNTEHPVEAARFMNFLLNSREMSELQACEKGIPASNSSLTAVILARKLSGMEHEALMKMRFYRDNLNMMLPVMENRELIESFLKLTIEFINGKLSREECARKMYREFSVICNP